MVVCDIDHMFVKHSCFDHTVEMGMCCGSNSEIRTGYDRMFECCIGFDHNGSWGMCFDQSLGQRTSFDHMVAHPLQILVAFVYLCVLADQGRMICCNADVCAHLRCTWYNVL